MCLLQEHGEDVEVREYLKVPPTEEELTELLKLLGIQAEDLIRKGESLFKEQFKNKSFSNTEWIRILAENPVLIERPIVIKNNKAVIGRPPVKVLDL